MANITVPPACAHVNVTEEGSECASANDKSAIADTSAVRKSASPAATTCGGKHCGKQSVGTPDRWDLPACRTSRSHCRRLVLVLLLLPSAGSGVPVTQAPTVVVCCRLGDRHIGTLLRTSTLGTRCCALKPSTQHTRTENRSVLCIQQELRWPRISPCTPIRSARSIRRKAGKGNRHPSWNVYTLPFLETPQSTLHQWLAGAGAGRGCGGA